MNETMRKSIEDVMDELTKQFETHEVGISGVMGFFDAIIDDPDTSTKSKSAALAGKDIANRGLTRVEQIRILVAQLYMAAVENVEQSHTIDPNVEQKLKDIEYVADQMKGRFYEDSEPGRHIASLHRHVDSIRAELEGQFATEHIMQMEAPNGMEMDVAVTTKVDTEVIYDMMTELRSILEGKIQIDTEVRGRLIAIHSQLHNLFYNTSDTPVTESNNTIDVAQQHNIEKMIKDIRRSLYKARGMLQDINEVNDERQPINKIYTHVQNADNVAKDLDTNISLIYTDDDGVDHHTLTMFDEFHQHLLNCADMFESMENNIFDYNAMRDMKSTTVAAANKLNILHSDFRQMRQTDDVGVFDHIAQTPALQKAVEDIVASEVEQRNKLKTVRKQLARMTAERDMKAKDLARTWLYAAKCRTALYELSFLENDECVPFKEIVGDLLDE